MGRQQQRGHQNSSTQTAQAPPLPQVAEVPESNSAAQEDLLAGVEAQGSGGRAGGAPGAPSAPPGDPTSGAASGTPIDLPFRAELEQSLGVDLSGIRAYVDPTACEAIGARAFARGSAVVFSESSPPIEVVSEEVVHALQKGGTSGRALSKRTDAAEVEAKSLATRIADGQQVGEPTATTSAEVMRDDTTPARPTREVVRGEFTIVVHEDAERGVARRPDAQGRWHCTETQLDAFGGHLDQMAVLRTTLLAIAARGARQVGYAREMRDALAGVAVEVKRYLRLDPVFLANPTFATDPAVLVRITDGLSPSALFVEALRHAWTGGVSGDALVAFVRDYARADAAEALAALVGSETLFTTATYGLTAAQRLACVAYMTTGGAEHAPATRMRIALESSDASGFRAAFLEISTNEAALAPFRDDAAFLNSVREKLGPDMHQMVQSRLLGGAAVDNADLGLTDDERRVIAGFAGTCCTTLRGEFTATFYTDDSNVLSALRGYLGNVDNTIAGVTNEEARRSKKEEARTLLKTLYSDTYHDSIAGGIRRGLDGDNVGTALGLIAAVGADTAAAIGDERARRAAGPGAGTPAGPPMELTADERTALQPHLDTALAAILRQEDSMWVDDAAMTAAIGAYERSVRDTVQAEDPTDVAHRNAERRRENQGILLLESEWARTYPSHRTLPSIVSGSMGGAAAQDALDVFEDARIVRDEVAEAAEYAAPDGAPLSEAERARVTTLARTHAQSLHDVVDDLVVVDTTFHARMGTAHDAIRTAVSPESGGVSGSHTTGQHRVTWRAKERAAMGILRAEYDGMYGSLVGDIHRYVQTEDLQRDCLQRIGDRGGVLTAAVDTVLGDLGAEGHDDVAQQAIGVRLEELEAAITRLAERFGGELDDTIVHDDVILGLCREFKTLKTTYGDLVQLSTHISQDTFLQWLERAYLPIGGSLRTGIVGGLDRPNAETALRDLGLGGVVQATTRIDEEGLTPAEIEAGRNLHAPGHALFATVDFERGRRRWDDSYGEQAAATITARVRAFKDAAPDATTAFLEEFYQREHFIRLGDHLGRVLPESHRAGVTAVIPGLTWGAFRGPTIDPVAAAQDAVTEAITGDPADLAFDPMRCSPGFSVEVAGRRASALHDLITAPSVDRPRLVRALTGADGGGGHREENRVIQAMYQRMYGVDLQYDIHRRFRTLQEDDRAFLEDLADNAGQGGDFVAEIRQEVRVGTDAAKNNIYSRVLMGSREDKQQLLADPTVFSEIQAKWDHETMDRVYRSATGEITLADMLRDRDEATEWYTFGLGGTDETGTQDDIKLFFRYLRRELGVGIDAQPGERTPAERAAALDGAVRARARALLADHDVRQMIDGEFGGSDLLQIEQLILGAGDPGHGAEAAHALADGSGDALLAQLREMSDAELAGARSDPAFISRLRTTLSGSQEREAMALLFGTHDSTEFAALEAALRGDAHGSDAGGVRTADYGGRDAVFTAVLGMSPGELATLAADAILVARIRAALSRSARDLALFNQLLGGVDVGGDHLRGAAELGASEAPGNAPMSDAEKSRIRDGLVIRYIVSLERAADQGEDQQYAAAQAAYNETGETVVQAAHGEGEGAVGERKEELYRDAERRRVWSAVEPRIARSAAYDPATQTTPADNPQYFTIKRAVLHERDPSGERLRRGFEWSDNDEAIDGAIDNASARYVVHEMSNIMSPGPGGTDSMALVYARFQNERAERDRRQAELALARAEGATDLTERQQALEQQENVLLLHRQRFVDFRLDVADLFALTLSQGGRTHTERREGEGSDIVNLTIETGDARYQALIGKVRARVLGLSNEDVAEGLGIPTEAYTEADIADPTERSRREADRTSDLGALMTDDRKDRSRASHAVDTYMHHRGGIGSLADAGRSDEAVDLEYARYMGTVGAATEGDMDSRDVGSIDRAEHEEIGERRQDFEGAISDLQAARAALRDILKWIAIAIITAAATALTGPGGPTLCAAMCTAAIQAGTIAVINEATMANDYQLWQEGMKDVVVQTATAAVTFGLARGSEWAVSRSPFLQSAADKLARFQAWEEGLEQGASRTLEGFGQYVLYSGGRAALSTGMSDFQDAVVGSIDLSQWKYGMDSARSHAYRTFDGTLDNVGDHMVESFWTTMVTSGAGAIYGRLRPPPDRPEGPLDGVELPESESEAAEVSMWGAMGSAARDTFGGRALESSGFDYTVGYLVDRAKDGDWEFDSDDIGSFIGGYAQNRASRMIGRTGHHLGEARNAREAARLWEEHRATFETRAQLHGLDPDAARRHFRHFLGSGVRDHERAFEEWQTAWTGFDQRMRRQVEGAYSPAEGEAYRAWVLAEPDKIDERLRFDVAAFGRARTSLLDQRQAIQNSAEFQQLGAEQQRFYLAYLASPSRLGVEGGGLTNDLMDVRQADGRTSFREAYGASKRAVVLHHLTDELAGVSEAERAAFSTMIAEVDPERGLPAVDPGDTAGAQRNVETWFSRWLVERRRLASDPTPSHGSE